MEGRLIARFLREECYAVVMVSGRPGHFHAVKFYESDDALCRIVAEFFAEGMSAQQPALLVATPRHRAGVAAELQAGRFDVKRLQEAGTLSMLDAQTVLGAVMVDGRPDANLFQAAVGRELERLRAGRHTCVRIYGDMADVLWKAGHDRAALQLEALGNGFSDPHAVKVLCGYAVTNFYHDRSLRSIFEAHSHVISDKGAIVHAHPTVRWGGPATPSGRPS
jgi:hypothetical protein